MAVKHAVEKRKQLARHRVTVSVGENRFVKSTILNGYPTCQMDFSYQPGRQSIDKLNGIEVMIAGRSRTEFRKRLSATRCPGGETPTSARIRADFVCARMIPLWIDTPTVHDASLRARRLALAFFFLDARNPAYRLAKIPRLWRDL
jgi:hypothetical protein